jgi:flagellar biosynthesis/type III secretory pathway protein FliH
MPEEKPDYQKTRCDISWDEGYRAGLRAARNQTYEDGLNDGRNEGFDRGRAAAFDEIETLRYQR